MDLFDQFGNKAREYFRTKNYESALEFFLKAYTVEPTNTIILDRLAETSMHLGNFNEAIDYLIIILDVEPFNSGAINNLGLLYEELNQPERTFDCYKISAEIEPDDSDAWINLGFVCNRLKRFEESVRFLEKADKLVPNLKEVLEYLSDGYSEIGKKYFARKTLRKIIYFFPLDYKAYINLANQFLMNGTVEKGIDLLEKSLKLNPDVPEIYLNLASAYLSVRNIPKALDTYLSAITKNPSFVDLFWLHNFQLSLCFNNKTKKNILEVAAVLGDSRAIKLLKNGSWIISDCEDID